MKGKCVQVRISSGCHTNTDEESQSGVGRFGVLAQHWKKCRCADVVTAVQHLVGDTEEERA